jgi:hypothetical protein
MKNERLNKKSLARAFDGLNEKNFDGHTDFYMLSSEQRLQWLSSGARFAFVVNRDTRRGAAQDVGRKSAIKKRIF